MAVKPIPEGYHTLTPYLIVREADKAIAFYQKAFGATELMRMNGPDGKVGHAELKIGDSMVMLSEENPHWGATSPQSLGGTPLSLAMYVVDVDASFHKAVEAGATIKRPLADQFYGDRSGTVTDPFGHIWTLSTHKEDVSHEEMTRRMEAFMQKQGSA
jgi:PhnB protein